MIFLSPLNQLNGPLYAPIYVYCSVLTRKLAYNINNARAVRFGILRAALDHKRRDDFALIDFIAPGDDTHDKGGRERESSARDYRTYRQTSTMSAALMHTRIMRRGVKSLGPSTRFETFRLSRIVARSSGRNYERAARISCS